MQMKYPHSYFSIEVISKKVDMQVIVLPCSISHSVLTKQHCNLKGPFLWQEIYLIFYYSAS